ncbi:hypothetical protein HF521_003902 [Silurus meridionalis]|uniref:Uncharacterized protein n=1 Tax=Silurus meridionalis TaxID=175797 RepID=A0A8T0AZN9_SILME|nr:hypothetical protein HF521_003902 [Silurus meridionalis]
MQSQSGKQAEMTTKELVNKQASDIFRRRGKEAPAMEGQKESELFGVSAPPIQRKECQFGLLLMVPVLVSNEQGVGQPPIIGYNVIQHLVSKGMEQHPDVVPEVVKEAFSYNCSQDDS